MAAPSQPAAYPLIGSVSKSMTETGNPTVENTDTSTSGIIVSNCSLYDTLVAAMKQRVANIERVALYARVSTKDGRQDTENQLMALRDYCAKQGWAIAGEYVDHETGGTSKRPHFQRMFADARARKFDLVLFWSLDRLSREGVLATLNHLERLTAAGVNWRSFTEEYLDSCGIFRDAVLSILATIARLRRQGHTEHLGRPRKAVDRGKVRRLHEQGASLRAIAAEMGIGAATAMRIVKGQ